MFLPIPTPISSAIGSSQYPPSRASRQPRRGFPSEDAGGRREDGGTATPGWFTRLAIALYPLSPRVLSRRHRRLPEDVVDDVRGGGAGTALAVAARQEAVGQHRPGQPLDVVGDGVIAALDQGQGLGG